MENREISITQSRRPILLGAGLIVLATVAAFSDSFTGVLVLDDKPSIVDNLTIRKLWPISKPLCPPNHFETVRGRPLLNLSLALNYAISGLDVRGYHATNLAIHILAALLLFGILRRTFLLPLLRERWGAMAVPLAMVIALVWAIHPLQTESVTYIIQRAESLMGLFYLATLYCFLRGAGSPRAVLWYAASVLACLLGMATKEVIVSAPLVVLLYDRTFLAGSFRGAWRQRWRFYLALAAPWLLLGWLVAGTGMLVAAYGGVPADQEEWFTWWSYLLTQPGVIVHYLRLAFWPSGQCLWYGWPPAANVSAVLFPAIPVASLLGLTMWALVKRPAGGFLGAWFFLLLAPTTSILPLQGGAGAFEHHMYLALAAVVSGVAVGACLAAQWLARRGTIPAAAFRIAGVCLAVSAAIALAVVTFQRNLAYRSDLAIWEDTVAKVPGNYRAYMYLGNALADCGQIDEAIAQYRQALKIRPDFSTAHIYLGFARSRRGQVDEAIAQFRKAVELQPNLAEAHNNLGAALARRGQIDEAIAHYRKAVELQPDLATAHNNLAFVLAGRGQVDEAIVHYQKAVELEPDLATAHNNLGFVLAGRGDLGGAIVHYRKALELQPDYVEAHNNLGNALAGRGQIDEAIAQYRQALKIKPDYAEAHYNLGIVLAGRGQVDEAIVHYQKAVEIKPDYVEAHNNFGIALARRGQVDEAIAQFRQALKIQPDFATARQNLDVLRTQWEKILAAVAQRRELLRVRPQDVALLNDTAWMLATNPNASVGNGREAVELARRAVALSGGREPAMLSTLAAAYAGAGQFAEAVQTARRALDLATQQGKQALVESILPKIRLYEAGKAFYELPQPSPAKTSIRP